MGRFDQAPDELIEFIPTVPGDDRQTPALRAAWLEMHDRLAKVARDELAAQAGIDPRDPEPIAAARALAGLAEVALESRIRRIREGLRGEELRRAADDDLERAARLLETGLWSFSVLPAASGPSSRRWRPPGRRTTPAPRCSRRCARRERRGTRCVARAAPAGTPGRCARRSKDHFREAQDQAKQHAERQAKQHAQRQAKQHAQRQAKQHAQRQARDGRRGGGQA